MHKFSWQNYFNLAYQHFKQYLKLQVKLFFIQLLVLTVAFYYLGLNYYFGLALGIVLVDILPLIGSAVIFVPWIIYLLMTGAASLAWQLALVFIILQIINQIAEIRGLGKDLNLPWWLSLVILLVCSLAFNWIGVIVAALITPLISAA